VWCRATQAEEKKAVACPRQRFRLVVRMRKCVVAWKAGQEVCDGSEWLYHSEYSIMFYSSSGNAGTGRWHAERRNGPIPERNPRKGMAESACAGRFVGEGG